MTTALLDPRDLIDDLDTLTADAFDHSTIADIHQTLTTAAALCDRDDQPPTTADAAIIEAARAIIGPTSEGDYIAQQAQAAVNQVPGYRTNLTLTPAAAAIRAADRLAAAHPFVTHR